MKIGILGGTFDPPHAGHLGVAHAALSHLELDEVMFLPANRNPFKPESSGSPAKHRLAMVQAMIAEEPRMAVSDMEITRGGISYSVDTLGELHMVRPAEYWFLIGADAIKGLSDWRNPQRLMRLCRLGLVLRPPATDSSILANVPIEFREKVDLVPMNPIDVSSSMIRDRIAQGLSVTPWLPASVSKYIKDNKLYRG